MYSRTAWCSLVLGTVLFASGCTQTLTYERWDTLYDGATPEVVQGTLGDPWQESDEKGIYHDTDRGITATIFFEDDEMIGKEWADPDRGFVGSNPHIAQPGDSDELRIQKFDRG